MSFLAARAVIIVLGVSNNWDIFVDYIGIVLVAVFLHDALALALGYGDRPRRPRLPDRSSRKAMTFEVGIRNAGLGLLLVFTYFDGLGGMALVAAWWGIWDIIAGLVVAESGGAGRAAARGPGGRGMRGPGHRRQRLPRALGRRAGWRPPATRSSAPTCARRRSDRWT